MHAPDLYIPVMSFATCELLSGIVLGVAYGTEAGNYGNIYLERRRCSNARSGRYQARPLPYPRETYAVARRHRLSWLHGCRCRPHDVQQPHRAEIVLADAGALGKR